MAQEEIKPSFSLKYVVLTLFTTVIVSGVGLIVSKSYESRPSRELEVLQGDQVDLLNDPAFPKDQIEANYYLKGKPKKKVATLFRKVVVVRNAGNEGAESIFVSATLAETNAHMVTTPKIRTVPREIVDAISVTKGDSGTDNKQTWSISLLNPGESVIFEYFVYSEEKLSSINLSILARKKDWRVVNKSLLYQRDAMESLNKIITVAAGVPVALLFFILALSVPFYRYQWNRRPDYREKYGTFLGFYNRHRPWDLFKPPASS